MEGSEKMSEHKKTDSAKGNDLQTMAKPGHYLILLLVIFVMARLLHIPTDENPWSLGQQVTTLSMVLLVAVIAGVITYGDSMNIDLKEGIDTILTYMLPVAIGIAVGYFLGETTGMVAGAYFSTGLLLSGLTIYSERYRRRITQKEV